MKIYVINIDIVENSIVQPCPKCWTLKNTVLCTLCHWIVSILCQEPLVLVSSDILLYVPCELLFPKAVIPNYHFYTELPPFLLVDDLSFASERKLRLQAGTPLTSCSYTYFCTFTYLFFSSLKDVSLSTTVKYLYFKNIS
jgi:hypothetical protein